MTDKLVLLTTTGSEQEAGKLARMLVEKRLAACVQIVPRIRSIYRWQGAIEDAEEWLLVIKSRRGLFDKLREALRQEHSYDVPELLALPVIDGFESYLNWIDRETDGDPSFPET